MKKLISPLTAVVTAAFSLTSSLSAQISYDGGTYSQDFDTLPVSITTATFMTGTGPFDVPTQDGGTLEGWSMWKNGGSGTDLRIQSNDGSANSGSIYFYGEPDSSERALGALASGSGAYTFGATFTNTSTETYTSFTLSYIGEQWRYGGSGASNPNNLTFSFAINATSIAAGSFTTVPELNFNSVVNTGVASALNGNLSQYQTEISFITTGLLWTPGSTLTIRWSDVDNVGSDDGLAVDNLSFSASSAAFTELTWAPQGGSTEWNTTTANWTVSDVATTYSNGDVALFTDAGVGAVTIDAAGVNPLQVQVTNTTGTYSFTGGDIGGTAQFVKTGAGAVEISNTISASGGILVQEGKFSTTAASLLASGANVTVGSGAEIEFAGAETLGVLSLTDSTVTTNAADPLTVSSGIQVNAGETGSVIQGALNSGATALAITVFDGAADIDLDLSADLGGSGRMVFSGGGTIELSGFNLSFGGGVTLASQTTLIISDNLSLGTNQFFFNGGTLKATSELTGINRIENVISIGGDVTIDGTNTIEFADVRTFFGNADKIQTIIGNVIISGPISFNNLINKGGDGTLILSAENTYSGNTTVQAGTLKLIENGTISNSPVIRVDNGATLDLSELATEYVIRKNDEVTQLLAGGGLVRTSSGGLLIEGVIAPGSALGGGGAETQTLTVDGNLAFGLESVIQIQLAGITSDLIDTISVINGIISLDGELVLSLLNGFAPTSELSFLIMQADSIVGQFSNVTFGERIDIAEGSFLISNTGTSVILSDFVPIPEPSVYLLITLIISTILIRRLLKLKRHSLN